MQVATKENGVVECTEFAAVHAVLVWARDERNGNHNPEFKAALDDMVRAARNLKKFL